MDVIEHFETLTLERFLKHTRPVGNCLEWTGHANNGKHPQIRLGGAAGRVYNVRRVVYALVRGTEMLDRGYEVGQARECCTDLCVHPEHMRARQHSQVQKGIPKSLLQRVRIAAAKRATSRIDADIIKVMQTSDEPGCVLDERYAVAQGYTSKVRRMELRPDYSIICRGNWSRP